MTQHIGIVACSAVLFLLIFAGSSMSVAADSPVVFDPKQTWLFVVGILQFQDAGTTSWDGGNRRDTQLVSLFKSRGTPADHIVYIADKAATKAAITRAFRDMLARTDSDDNLIVYYTGHGSDGSFETYDGDSWEMQSILRDIENTFNGPRTCLLGDCCQSGSLANALTIVGGSKQYAVMSSSSRTEEGHGNWTFSQALLEGLRGDPLVDTNHDGRISLLEVADHVKDDILTYEDNHSVFKTAGGFEPNIVMSATAPGAAVRPQPVEVMYNGDWWRAKMLGQKDGKAHIRWIQLGYDSPEQDEWIDVKEVCGLQQSK